MASDDRPTCFVLMPFGHPFDDYYTLIYRAAAETAGLQPIRADDIFQPGVIVDQIWRHIGDSAVVLADLSGLNPNVMYEVGLAHALAIPSVLVSESVDTLPFDLRALRVLEYDKSHPAWGDNLRGAVADALNEALASPETSVPAAFLTHARSPSSAQADPAVAEIQQDLRLLRQSVGDPKFRYSYDPHEVDMLVQTYVARGKPDDYILSRLHQRGVNPKFVLPVLARIRANDIDG